MREVRGQTDCKKAKIKIVGASKKKWMCQLAWIGNGAAVESPNCVIIALLRFFFCRSCVGVESRLTLSCAYTQQLFFSTTICGKLAKRQRPE